MAIMFGFAAMAIILGVGLAMLTIARLFWDIE
jgi:hypothetical protein